MNNTFNINRFGRYITTDIRSAVAEYGLGIMLISLMGVIIYTGTVLMGMIFNGTWEGPGIYFRATTFIISMFVLIVTAPVKCYGRITEKKAGSDWLMVPVSGLEKFLSMTIMTVFIIPIASAGTYLCLDAILCAIDHTCGQSMIASFKDISDVLAVTFSPDAESSVFPAIEDFVKQVSSPWLYIDDIIGMCLIFLLGAVMFKKSKTVKTFVAIFVITTALGTVATPIVTKIFGTMFIDSPDSAESLEMMVNDLWIFRHVALFDTINDTIVNLALMTGIYFRIKTLKH